MVDAELRQWFSRDGIACCGSQRPTSGVSSCVRCSHSKFGQDQMKSTDESGVGSSIRGHITEVAKPLVSAAEVSRKWDSLLFEDGKFSCCLGDPCNFENHRVWNRHGKSIRLRRKLVRCVRANWRCHAGACTGRSGRGELDQTWRNGRGPMEIMMSKTKQNNLRSSGEFQLHASPQSWRGTFSDKSCCVCTVVRSVCVCVCVCENKGTGAQHRRQTVKELCKARTRWTQNLLRLLLHVCGRSCDTDVCVGFSKIRQSSCHGVRAEGLDAVRCKVLCRLIQQTGVRRCSSTRLTENQR